MKEGTGKQVVSVILHSHVPRLTNILFYRLHFLDYLVFIKLSDYHIRLLLSKQKY